MTDGNLTVKCGFITWGTWVTAAILISVDAVLAWTGPITVAGPLGNCGILLAAAAATWTACTCIRAVGRQILAELARVRRDKSPPDRDRVHALQ